MSMFAVPNETGTTTAKQDQGRWTSRLARLALLSGVLAAVLLLLGFGWFAFQIPRSESAKPASAEAIIALTGGAERVSDALDLLAAGRARRLLITGVNPETSKEEIQRLHPGSDRVIDCCVDLDRRALNTAGNALEARLWVRSRGYRRVIVVTSSWHMPRTLVELGRAMPEVDFLPYPVVAGRLAQVEWWQDDDAFRLLVTEYVKYLAALVHIRVAPRIAREQPSVSLQPPGAATF